LAKEAPKYETGVKMFLGCAVSQVVLALCLRALLARRNAQRDHEEAEGSHTQDADIHDVDAIEDTTDFHNQKFRYAI
jgi:hypothetical protein